MSTKYSFLTTNCRNSFPKSQSKSGLDPKFLKRFIFRHGVYMLQASFAWNKYCEDKCYSKHLYTRTLIFNSTHI